MLDELDEEAKAMEIMEAELKKPAEVEPKAEVVKDQVQEQPSEKQVETEEVVNDVEATQTQEEPKEEVATPEVKQENAFKAISQKLKAEKEAALKATQDKEALKAEADAKLLKIAKKVNLTVDELNAIAGEETEALPAEVQAQLQKAKDEASKAHEELNAIKLETGIKQLLTLGGDDKSILKFLSGTEKTYGIDFRKSPNPELMARYWKVENADQVIEQRVQERLRTESKTVTVKQTNSTPKQKTEISDFDKLMTEYAKNN